MSLWTIYDALRGTMFFLMEDKKLNKNELRRHGEA